MPTASAKSETVDGPAYYGGKDNPYEVIKVLEAHGMGPHFCLGNAIKYILRAGRKGGALASEIEDLEKAAWYVQRRLKQLKGEVPGARDADG